MLWLKIALSLLIFTITHSMCGCSPPDITIVASNLDAEEDAQGDDGDSGVALPSTVSSVSIEYIKGLYGSSSQLITTDLAIEGVITANDVFGEYPNSIIIEDSSGAIEVKGEVECATSGYIVGATVYVLCSGLWLGSTGGTLSLGAAPSGQYPTSELSESEFLSCVRISDEDYIIPIPTVTKISTLTSNHILRYVRMDNLSFDTSTSTTFCTRDEESGQTQHTEHTLSDLQGDQITLCVGSSVIYADQEVPTDIISIYGIIEYFNGEYRLRIVNCGYE